MHRWLWVFALVACGDDAATPDAPDAPVAIDATTDACACTYDLPTVTGRIGAPAVELSGLAASHVHPALWTHNDSDSTPRVIALSLTGAVLGELALPGATITDWEDIALGPCGASTCIFLGDIGDNQLARTSVRIYEIDEPAGTASRTGTFRAFDIAYPDGPHNAEALVVDPRDGETYVIVKQPEKPTPVFRMPRITGSTATAEQVGSFTVITTNAPITAADLIVDTCGVRMLVRTYDRVFELRGSASATISELLASTPASVTAPSEMQGEAITYEPDGRGFYTTTEGTNVPLSHVRCR